MNRIERALVRVATDLAWLKVPWALVGGFAVSVRAEPRLTRDVDVVVAAGADSEAERTVRDLSGRGWRPVEIVEQEALGRIATARLAFTDEGRDEALLDVLFASSGIESEIARNAEIVEVVPGVAIPVATRADLIALKLLARDDRSRPQDADDLAGLIRKASPEELHRTRDALTLIMDRGFNRKRNLLELFGREIDQGS
jgi:predicted nucleotidyltransferase